MSKEEDTLFHIPVLGRGSDQGLRGNATPVEADPAQFPVLDNGHAGPLHGRPDSGGVAARAASDYGNLVVFDLSTPCWSVTPKIWLPI